MKELVDLLERRVTRERLARREAESLLERKSLALYQANEDLKQLAQRQEELIEQRTREYQLARDEAITASSAKSAFLANMSHEIRTPLTSIIGFAELLLNERLSESDRASALRTIIRNGRHLLEVINDILDLSKIETGQVELEELAIDLPALLSELTTLVAGRAEEKALQFEIVPKLPLPGGFRGDPLRIKQILLNFCSNAVKFTERGGVRLELRYDDARRMLTFTVADTGIGMTDEQLGRLFQPFVQADISTTRRFGGTGLGLYLSQQLAAALGASIRVDSLIGRGSAFHLDLPLREEPLAESMLTMEGDLQIHAAGSTAITDFAVPQLGGRVLLAEDGVDNQRLLATYLRQAGLEATVVGNGRDAVEAALSQDFDLVLMDIQMPVLDGVGAMRMLRRAGYRQPIVALTANVMKSDVQKYLEAGCDDVLGKPVERERFYAVIDEQLGRRRAARPASEGADDEFEREIAALAAEFRRGLPDQVRAIEEAAAQADWATLASLVHTLKGTAGSYGFAHLTELAAGVEAQLAAARHGQAVQACRELVRQARAGAPANTP
ncbi:MAG TPA: ATP-binding protein [Methylibium sp.]|nr:ATP-binding protein [Methylibium sp.]